MKPAAKQATPPRPSPRPNPGHRWAPAFARNALLLLLPAALAWTAVTPFYNAFLLNAGENLVQLTESPNVTDLHRRDRHNAFIARRDFPPARALVHSFRVTDVHFHLVLVLALFLAVPGIPWRRRLENLGWAVLATVCFDLLLIFFQVKFVYATQLGDWSLRNYGPVARNVWGLGKHLLDLPFKLGLPLLLWAGFYLRYLLDGGETDDDGRGR
jgi:hypothetical protein